MRVALFLLIGLHVAICCTIVPLPVKGAAKRAEIVFRGRITEISDTEIIFRVERVWKGHVQATFAMPKIVWSDFPCFPGFRQGYVRVGTEMLVYARRRLPALNVDGYVCEPGSRTALIQNAAADLRILGHGHPPATR